MRGSELKISSNERVMVGVGVNCRQCARVPMLMFRRMAGFWISGWLGS